MKPKEVAALMGRLVVVDKQLVRRCADHSRDLYEWEAINLPFSESRTGWIVGSTRLQNGSRYYVGYEEGWEFRQKGPTTPALLVAFWPNQRPVRVPVDGWRLAAPDDPKPHVGAFTWDEASKEEQRKIMLAHQRDANGRWIKGGYQPAMVD